MREIKIDFSKGHPILSSKEAGFVGEVNATNITIVPPEYMTNDERITKYYVKFETNKGVVSSESFSANGTIEFSLCYQLTTGEHLMLQLVGKDDEGQVVTKSSVVYLLLSQGINKDGKIINQNEMPSEEQIIQLVSVDVKSDTDDEYILTITTKDGSFDTPNLIGKQGERGVSGVYVGSDEMPEGYNVQINPNGTVDSSVPVLTVRDNNNNIVPIVAIQGLKGDEGKSAYESAVEGGYAETEPVFYQQLANIGKIETALEQAENRISTIEDYKISESFAAVEDRIKTLEEKPEGFDEIPLATGETVGGFKLGGLAPFKLDENGRPVLAYENINYHALIAIITLALLTENGVVETITGDEVDNIASFVLDTSQSIVMDTIQAVAFAAFSYGQLEYMDENYEFKTLNVDKNHVYVIAKKDGVVQVGDYFGKDLRQLILEGI